MNRTVVCSAMEADMYLFGFTAVLFAANRVSCPRVNQPLKLDDHRETANVPEATPAYGQESANYYIESELDL